MFGLSAKQFSLQYLSALYAKQGAWKHLRNFDADVANFGESVSFPSFPRLSAVAVTPATGGFTNDNTSITQQTVLINGNWVVSYQVPESNIIQSKIDVKAAFAEQAALAVTDRIDHSVAALIASISSNTAGANGSDLTETYCLAAMGKLVDNYVPLTNPDDLCWILPSSQFGPTHALKAYAQGFRFMAGSASPDGGNDVKPALDTLYGIPVFFRNDSELSVTGGKIGGLFYTDSVGVAIQRMPHMRPIVYVPDTINVQLVCHTLFGVSLVKEYVATKIRCK
jgi:hypothetical protein